MNMRIFFLNNNVDTRYFGYDSVDELVFNTTVNFDVVDQFIEKHKGQPIFTLLSYDLKNNIEELSSKNPASIHTPNLIFVVPKEYIKLEDENYNLSTLSTEAQFKLRELLKKEKHSFPCKFEAKTTKEEYLKTVETLKEHIQQGDFYEINYCQEFVSTNTTKVDPIAVYQTINSITSAPFSAFVQFESFALACGSPERFIKKTGNSIISQPIKGTAPRGATPEDDALICKTLLEDPKERAENVMIVDLVRNDLSKIAKKGSVQVPELFGIYTFPTVHQMISTISCELKENTKISDLLKATFPMGSMTGAPKISALKHIEYYENFKRGFYSGSVGIIEENGDFDWNVIIRSMQINLTDNTLSCAVGGAITIDCEPEKEYQECLIKVGRILQPFQG